MNMIKRFCLLLGAGLLLANPVSAGTLSDTPLSLKGAVPPNVMFGLSVEYPTANTAAYQDEKGYSANNEYLGYFDPAKCYGYDTGNGRFYPTALASGHACTAGWSGNFLNWGTMTGLDEFRYAMTGGNRSSDTATLTVLERTYQSGQGGTGNFPDKSYTDTAGTATPYAAGTIVTLQNQGRGIQVLLTPAGSLNGVVSCTGASWNAAATPPFSCTLTLGSTVETSACSTWGGNGTAASPYSCTSFSGFSGLVLSSSTPVSPPQALIVAGGTATNLTCDSPTLTGSAFSCGSLTLSNGHTGTCTTVVGDGSAASPYTCTGFSTFSGGEVFTPAQAAPTLSTFTTTTPGAQVQDDGTGSEVGTTGRITCSLSGSGASTTLSCPLSVTRAIGDNAVCSTFSGAGTNANPYYCGSFGFTGGETYVASSYSTRNGAVTYGGKVYYTRYRITYNLPSSSESKTYAKVYSGSTGATVKYYTASYNVGFGQAVTLNVRVKVCDSSVGLESNCKQFGSAWKPTGVIQDNGDRMRFGVTSYFQANDTDNAVLRSKAKYVAPLQYSPSGGSITNPYMEWNPNNGVFYRNPANCDSGASGCTVDSASVTSQIGTVADTGVINYVNKFGSTSHTYKTYDDTGKLYYETLKYLRRLSPTTDFYNGATAANADSFPVITQWDDPILYSCQKNYVIMMGDTHTWCDKRLPGGTYGAGNNGVCNAYSSNGNAHVEDRGSLGGDSGVDVTTQTGRVGTWEGIANLATSYTGAGSSAGFGMAGLASWAAHNDIRPASGDYAGTQTVTTYVIDVQENKDCGYQSQYWLAAKYGNPASYDSSGNWLTTNNPWSKSLTLPGGACASRSPPGYASGGGAVTWPKNLLRAGDPQSMIASVRGAIEQIVAQIGDEAALAQSSGSLDTGTGAYIYRATYNSGGWIGDVQALLIDQTGTVSSTPVWSASAKLPAATARHIFSFNDNTRVGVAFDPASFSSDLSASQQSALNADQFGVADGLGQDRMRYLRGDQSQEANLPGTTTPNPNANYGWRSRTALLGDVINSNPVYVGAPTTGYSDPNYKAFAATYAGRTPMVYVGGNDGMLHGYDASFTIDGSGTPQATTHSGTELLAYVPSAIYGKLSQLMSPSYSHKYFVDGSPVVADACLSNCSAPTDWKTVLVGTLNAGGQGVFALDVTDPADANGASRFTASKVMWEFTDQDDADLGFTFSRPIVRKLNDGHWYVIVGNGFNNTVADSRASATGRAYLFLLPVAGPGAGQAWVSGTNYYKIELTSPSESSAASLPLNPPNGLSSLAGVDRNLDGMADYVYVGDRNGNLWKIDLSSDTPGNWKAAFGTLAQPLPLFTTSDGAGSPAPQPVSTGIEVVRHPNGGFLVMFGTGTWIETTDPIGPFRTQSLYGIWDKDDGVSTVSGRSALQKQKVVTTVKSSVDASGNVSVASCTLGTSDCQAVFSNCQPNYSTNAMSSNASAPLCPSDIAYPNNTGQQYGWVLDMPLTGERIRSSFPATFGKNVRFTTLTPASDPCTGNTVGLEYNLSYMTGGSPEMPVFVRPGTTTGYLTLSQALFPGYTGASVQVVASGRLIEGGASDQPVTFSARPPSGVVPSAAGLPSPPTSACVGAGCGAAYIPGWGFLMNLQGATAANVRYALSCHPPQFGAGLPVCNWEFRNARFGRINWKQILR